MEISARLLAEPSQSCPGFDEFTPKAVIADYSEGDCMLPPRAGFTWIFQAFSEFQVEEIQQPKPRFTVAIRTMPIAIG